MEDVKDEKAFFNGFSERLTLGIIRVLGYYGLWSFSQTTACVCLPDAPYQHSTHYTHNYQALHEQSEVDLTQDASVYVENYWVIVHSMYLILKYVIFIASTESLPGVSDVRFVEREPAEKRCLLSWEQVRFIPAEWRSRCVSEIHNELLCLAEKQLHFAGGPEKLLPHHRWLHAYLELQAGTWVLPYFQSFLYLQ